MAKHEKIYNINLGMNEKSITQIITQHDNKYLYIQFFLNLFPAQGAQMPICPKQDACSRPRFRCSWVSRSLRKHLYTKKLRLPQVWGLPCLIWDYQLLDRVRYKLFSHLWLCNKTPQTYGLKQIQYSLYFHVPKG